MPTILIIGFKPPNQRKARAHPRSKNPDTLGPVPRTMFSYKNVPDAFVQEISAGHGKRGRDVIREIEDRLWKGEYRGRYLIQLHRSPKCNHKLPKYFRKSRPGPTTIYEGKI